MKPYESENWFKDWVKDNTSDIPLPIETYFDTCLELKVIDFFAKFASYMQTNSIFKKTFSSLIVAILFTAIMKGYNSDMDKVTMEVKEMTNQLNKLVESIDKYKSKGE